MTKEKIITEAKRFTEESQYNYIDKESAICPQYTEMQIFEAPIFAFGAANDIIFNEFKSPEIIGEMFITPNEWLPDADTVISFFLPYTDIVKSANSTNYEWPANEWLHGRYEGQIFLQELMIFLKNLLSDAGQKVMIPTNEKVYNNSSVDIDGITKFVSNWSERHVAYACGLGTFGLSKGLITEKGVCGRFGSLLTDLNLPKDKRKYSDPYEYCTMCGACVHHCPIKAIALDSGKNSFLCSEFLNKVSEKHKPRYGCGKCQVKVPCESRIPRGVL